MPARLSVVDTTPPPRAGLDSHERCQGNFWTIVHKFLLHRDPRTCIKARTERRAHRRISQAGLRNAEPGTVGALGRSRTPANTTPPPGPQLVPACRRSEPPRHRPRVQPRAPHEPAADIAACRTHWARHSVTTFRNIPRMLTITPLSSRRSSFFRFQQRPLSNCSRKLYFGAEGRCP
jgi:hypothetical protein